MVLTAYALASPSRGRLLLRGLARRCPLCGRGRLFRWWLLMRDRCPRCDLRFERIEGHWIGAVAVNTVLALITLLGVVVGGVVLTHPDPPLVGLMVVAGATAGVAPVLWHPFSRTLWTAIDLALRPIEAAEIS